MRKIYLFSFFISFLFLVSCKPTEKGYKAAYDAALNKREAAKSDILDSNLIEGSLQQADGPQLKEIDGVKVYILNQRIKPVDDTMTLPGSYNVAVATYKMITNCSAQVNSLVNEGYKAFAAKEADGMFFTIAASFPTLKEAVEFYQKFQKEKDRAYIGFPNAPVIIFSPK